MSDIGQNSNGLNQAAAHDTSLYDPAVHDNQIVALYGSDAQARVAHDTMVQAGFPASTMQVLARDGANASADTAGGTTQEPMNEGLWGSIKSLFVPDEDRTTYNTAVARGHAMLVVTPERTMDRQHLIHVLESTNPLDFDAKLEEWRQSGYDRTGGATGTSTSNTATAGHAVDAGLNVVHPTSQPSIGQPSIGQPGIGQPGAGMMPTQAATAPMATTGTVPAATVGGETIKVLEERLRVGKREVASGAVRIRSYIVERPVEEQVTLHQEQVGIERHPVDRAATPADLGAFQERTIEARATSEEAVVGKEARVVEEIGVNKQASDRTETVKDTVRKTEVEVEGEDAASRTGTLPGNTGPNPNTTPGATTSGGNSPRK